MDRFEYYCKLAALVVMVVAAFVVAQRFERLEQRVHVLESEASMR